MNERVTDERVEALSVACRSYQSQYQPCDSGEVLSLCAEVQQARSRRCGNCTSYRPSEITEATGTCADLVCPDVTPDWFCADFQPKEAA